MNNCRHPVDGDGSTLSIRLIFSPRPDLPPHKGSVGENKAEEGEGDQPGKLRPYQQQALSQRQGTGDGALYLLHGEGSQAAHGGHQQCGGSLAEQFVRHHLHQQEAEALKQVNRPFPGIG